MEPESAVHNLPMAFVLPAGTDVQRLGAALQRTTERHPALRAIHSAEDAPVAVPSRPVLVSSPAAAEQLTAALADLAGRPFELEHEPPFRAHLLRVDDGRLVLCLVVHHIAFDAASTDILLADIQRAYDRPGEPALPGPSGQEAAELIPTAESREFWRRQLASFDAGGLHLYSSGGRADKREFAAGKIRHPLSGTTVDALRTLRKEARLSVNMVLLTTYYAMLARHGAGPDLVVGVPVSTRDPGSADIGHRISNLPVRVAVDPRHGFRRLGERVRDALSEAMKHADVSYEGIVGELGLRSADWRRPLFRHMLNFPPPRTGSPEPLPLFSDGLPVSSGQCLLDLEIIVHTAPSSTMLEVVHRLAAFDADAARTLVQRFERLLLEAAVDLDRPIAELDMWLPEERAVVSAVNRSSRGEEAGDTVLDRFLDRAASTPEDTAVIDQDGAAVSYSELRSRAAEIARRLAAEGVAAGDVVALSLRRGADLAAAAMAVWAAGAAYLPLDPGQPVRRLVYQLEDAGVAVVVAGPETPAECMTDRVVIRVDTHAPGAAGTSSDVPAKRSGPRDIAYVIYTSGSTGRPKGVQVTQGNLRNLVGSFISSLGIGPGDRALWLTTFAFDISALEVFMPLVAGASVVVAPDAAQTDARSLADLVERHQPSILQATPTTWRLVLQLPDVSFLAGRQVLCGGEPMSAVLARRLRASGCRLFNVYGPTETTIWSTMQSIDGDVSDPVSIGRPISNTTVFVLDEHGQQCPIGVPGELCIAGAGVASGYLGRPELTADRFRLDDEHGRYYRTGDTARWRPDGTLEVLGRSDRQVKVRGHRVELGEVEAVIEENPAVAAAAVVLVGAEGDARLIGYVEPAGPPAPDLAERIWQQAWQLLPRHALPAIAVVSRLPRNGNGKIDYPALPDPRSLLVQSEAEPGAEADQLLDRLVQLWQELLEQSPLHADTNFFAHGGHSLLALSLAERVTELTGCEVDLGAVFASSTPRRMAEEIRSRGRHMQTVPA
jgi:amino acid adenylation domain-containing protein